MSSSVFRLVPGRLFENGHLSDHLQYRAKQIKASQQQHTKGQITQRLWLS